MSFNKPVRIGFILTGLWCIVTAFSEVYTGSFTQHFSISTLCFYIFSISLLVFVILNKNHISLLLQKCGSHKKEVVAINITTLGCWFLLIYPLKFIEPSIVAAISIGIAPVVTLLAGKLLYKNQKTSTRDYFIAFALFIVILYLSSLSVEGHSAVKNYTFQQSLLAIILAIVGGAVLGINTLITKRLNVVNFTPFDILMVRFLLMIIVTGLMQFSFKTHMPLSFGIIPDLLIITFCLVIIPQLLFQNSIKLIDPISISIMASIMPVLTFFLEFADHRLHPNFETISGIIGISIIAIIGTFLRYKFEEVRQKRFS